MDETLAELSAGVELLVAPSRSRSSDPSPKPVSAGVELLVAPSRSRSSDPSPKPVSAGVELLVATPGRLVDLVERGRAVLGGLKVLALLEVGRLLAG